MKTSTFNKSEILKKAWSLVKTKGWSLRDAMRTAWAYARNGASTYKGDAERVFITGKRIGDKLSALSASLNRGL